MKKYITKEALDELEERAKLYKLFFPAKTSYDNDYIRDMFESIPNLISYIKLLEAKLDLADSILDKACYQQYDEGYKEGEKYGRKSV